MAIDRKQAVEHIVDKLLQDYTDERVINNMEVFMQPDKDIVIDIAEKMLKIIYPGYFRDKAYRFYNSENRIAVLIEDVMFNLVRQITIALPQSSDYQGMTETQLEERATGLAISFFETVPKIREYVETDVEAFYDGDPAAYNMNEIILSYPGLLAITINRIAHELFLLKVPIIPRMMTEYAHSITGIDIHPGATIGKYFFIDHGTGIVIGETTKIGNNVKIYQGVTLGALSTRGGQKLKGSQRHPTIEDNVVIYAGASILGGETVIGENAVIGSNAFITSSIEKGARVSIKNQELSIKSKEYKEIVVNDLPTDENWFYVI